MYLRLRHPLLPHRQLRPWSILINPRRPWPLNRKTKAMTKKTRKSVVLAMLQASNGVPVVPTGANAMQVSNISSDPVNAQTADRDIIKPNFGASEKITYAVHQEIDFEVELVGSGVAGTAPKWAPLLRACGFAETITADTDVKYSLVSEDPEQLTLWYYLDGVVHKMINAIGTVTIDLTSNQIPKFKFHFMGDDDGVVDMAAFAGVDFSGFKLPRTVGYRDTPQWSLHGESPVLAVLTFDLGNTLNYKSLVGAQGAERTDRQTVGTTTFELGAVADKDWWSVVREDVTGPLSFTQGRVAGQIVQFDAPSVQLTELKNADDNGTARLSATLTLLPVLGNDELVITVK